MKLKPSVVIPTYNRRRVLLETLRSLERQSLPPEAFEVVVVDDASTDGTAKALKTYAKATVLNFKSSRLRRSRGAAAARNKGVGLSSGSVILFLGDDIVASKNLLREHLKTRRQNKNAAVLGYVGWHPKLKVTSFMKTLAPAGDQFNYGAIKNKRNVGYRFFYTSNLSIPRRWLEKERFDESFRDCGWEDIDLGLRLQKRGLRTILNKRAVGHHLHPYTPKTWDARMKTTWGNFLLFAKKHPPEALNIIQEYMEDNMRLRKDNKAKQEWIDELVRWKDGLLADREAKQKYIEELERRVNAR